MEFFFGPVTNLVAEVPICLQFAELAELPLGRLIVRKGSQLARRQRWRAQSDSSMRKEDRFLKLSVGAEGDAVVLFEFW